MVYQPVAVIVAAIIAQRVVHLAEHARPAGTSPEDRLPVDEQAFQVRRRSLLISSGLATCSTLTISFISIPLTQHLLRRFRSPAASLHLLSRFALWAGRWCLASVCLLR